MLKRSLLFAAILLVVMGMMVGIRFGGALAQEDDPWLILAAAAKLELTNSDYVLYSSGDTSDAYISATRGEARYSGLMELMKSRGWSYKWQMGSGLVFDKAADSITIETRQYSKHYMLWQVPKRASEPLEPIGLSGAEAEAVRQLAWDSLSVPTKQTVKGDWKQAPIQRIAGNETIPLREPGKSAKLIYKVTFFTTQDAMLGPIGIYIDPAAQEIVGRDGRE